MSAEKSSRHSSDWTAIRALILAIASGAYTAYSSFRGPKVSAFPLENVILLAMPTDGSLAAIAVPELANTAATYPDIIVEQSIHLLSGSTELACLSSRGGAQVHVGETAFTASDEAELISLTGLQVEVTDVSSRAELPAGRLFTTRQLFDQLATTSEVDPCYSDGAQSVRYSVAQLMEHASERITIRYEAELARDDGVFIECAFDLNERRVERLTTRGWINVPCSDAHAGKLPPRSLGERLSEGLGRLF